MPDFDVDFVRAPSGRSLTTSTRSMAATMWPEIVTFGTMAARAAVRDVGRVMGMSYQDVDRCGKAHPTDLKK